jgi:hypothetical protein
MGFDIVAEVADEVQSGEEGDEWRACLIEIEVIFDEGDFARCALSSSVDETKARNTPRANVFLQSRSITSLSLVPPALMTGSLDFGLARQACLTGRLPLTPVCDFEEEGNLCDHTVNPCVALEICTLPHNKAVVCRPLDHGVRGAEIGDDGRGSVVF